MQLDEALEWAKKNCDKESVDRLRSRAVVKALTDHIDRLNKRLEWQQDRHETVSSHGPGCHTWGNRHYDCLLSKMAELEVANHRYEYLRTLNVPQFQDLFKESLAGAKSFDELVDEGCNNRALSKIYE